MHGGMQQLDGITRRKQVGSSAATLGSPSFALQNTTVTNDMSADGYSWAQALVLKVDKNGNLFAIAQATGGAVRFVYSNDAGATWTDNSLSESFLARGTCAYDSTNDTVHVLWNAAAAGDGMIYRRYTIGYSGTAITGFTKDATVNLQLDFQGAGTMSYEHPIMLWMNDGGADGTYGKLLAIWSARNSGGGGGNEIRASMCVLGATANQGATAGNWAAPNTADTTGIGNAPAVAYSILATNTNPAIMYHSAMRKASNTNAGDIYLFYADGANVNTWTWRRLKWKSASNNWSNGLTAAATVSAIKRAGVDTGYAFKQQIGAAPREDTGGDKMFFGFATWKDNTSGDTWSCISVNSADVLSSIADVYSAGGAHSFAPTGDIAYDNTAARLVVSYIKTSTQAAAVQLFDNALTQQQSELVAFSSAPVDIPLLYTRLGTKVAVLFRDTNSPKKGWYGTLTWQ